MKDQDTDQVLTVSLREYFDSKFEALDKANAVAYEAMERRLESMNEFRETLRDQASKFVTRVELEEIKGRIEADIRVLREFRADLMGKASQSSVNLALVLSFCGLLIGIVGLVIRFIP